MIYRDFIYYLKPCTLAGTRGFLLDIRDERNAAIAPEPDWCAGTREGAEEAAQDRIDLEHAKRQDKLRARNEQLFGHDWLGDEAVG